MGAADDFLKLLSRHLVPFVYECEVINDDGPTRRWGYASGFVLSMFGSWFWVTAGHCLDLLDKTVESGDVKLLSTGFADYFGSDAKHQHIYPIAYEPNSALKIEDAPESLDYAVLKLRDLEVKGLQANGIKVVGPENWNRQSEVAFSHYAMLGFPADSQVLELDDGRIGLRSLCLRIEKTDNCESSAEGNDWFVGHIVDDAVVPDIAGMSGGPIFGFSKTGDRWRYHIVALQSRWSKERRIIKGCSLPYFAGKLQTAIERFIAEDPDSV